MALGERSVAAGARATGTAADRRVLSAGGVACTRRNRERTTQRGRTKSTQHSSAGSRANGERGRRGTAGNTKAQARGPGRILHANRGRHQRQLLTNEATKPAHLYLMNSAFAVLYSVWIARGNRESRGSRKAPKAASSALSFVVAHPSRSLSFFPPPLMSAPPGARVQLSEAEVKAQRAAKAVSHCTQSNPRREGQTEWRLMRYARCVVSTAPG